MAFLMNSQKALLHEIIEGHDFNANDFVIVPSQHPMRDVTGDSFRFKKTDYHFTVYPKNSKLSHAQFVVYCSPGNHKLLENHFCRVWDELCNVFIQYLSWLRREITTIDPWASATEYTEIIDSISDRRSENTISDNDSLPLSEREVFWNALTTIQATLLENIQDTSERDVYVISQINILKDAVTKFGRKDYVMLLYTMLAGIITTVGASPETGAAIFNILKETISHIRTLAF